MSPSVSDPPGDQGIFADKLTIETPEQTSLEFAVAGIGSRFVAITIDMLIQIAIGIVLGVAGGFAIAGLAKATPKAAIWAAAVLMFLFFALYFGYFAIFEIIWNGQTPGKRRVGIRVIKDSGRPLTVSETIGRNLMRIVDWMPAFYAVGIVSAMISRDNKRLGDLVVGSLVVRERSLSAMRPAWQLGDVSANPMVTVSPLGSANLTADDFAIIDAFLNRRYELDPQLRFRMADDILRRFKPKLTLSAENIMSSEKLLESLSHERRAIGSYSR